MSDAVARTLPKAAPQGGVSPEAAKLGAELRARRLSLGWTLPDLAASLRIRQSYLESIEAGRISDLPGTTYALGFVRAYASVMGLPGEQMAGRFRAESAEANIRPALSFPAPVPQRGVPAGALMLLGTLILAGAYSGWYYFSAHQRTPAETVPPIPDRLLPPRVDKPAPSPQVASILPSAAPPAQQAAAPVPAITAAPAVIAPPAPAATSAPPVVTLAPASPLPAPPPPSAPLAAVQAGTRIVVKASADAWVSVKAPNGTALLNKVLHAGETWPVPPGEPGLALTTGNAGATEIDVDGTPIPSLGAGGMVRRDVPLDADLLKSGKLPPPKPKKAAAPPPGPATPAPHP